MKLAFCVACGKTADLHQCRLVTSMEGGGDDEDNLITLCGSCYAKLRKRLRLTKAEQVEQASERAEALRPILVELKGMSTHAIAAELNRRGVPTPTGAPWSSMTVIRVQRRRKDAR